MTDHDKDRLKSQHIAALAAQPVKTVRQVQSEPEAFRAAFASAWAGINLAVWGKRPIRELVWKLLQDIQPALSAQPNSVEFDRIAKATAMPEPVTPNSLESGGIGVPATMPPAED